jgi:hypothetical protein
MAWPQDSRKARGLHHPRRHRCPHLFTKYFSYQTTKRAGSLASQGSWPAPTILSILPGDLGAGSRSRLVTTAIDGYRKSSRFPLLCVRVGRYRQRINWPVSNSDNRQTASRRAYRPRATRWSSGLCRAALSVLSGSLTLKSFRLIRCLSTREARAVIYKLEDPICQ